MFPHRKP